VWYLKVSSRVSTKYSMWERLIVFVSWVEWYCCTLGVEAADFFVVLLSLWHTAQSFTPEYFNLKSASFALITAHFRQKYCWSVESQKEIKVIHRMYPVKTQQISFTDQLHFSTKYTYGHYQAGHRKEKSLNKCNRF